MNDNINCEVIRDLLPLYAENMLSDSSRTLVDNHLSECEGCRNMATEIGRTIQVSRIEEIMPLKKFRRRMINYYYLLQNVFLFIVLSLVFMIRDLTPNLSSSVDGLSILSGLFSLVAAGFLIICFIIIMFQLLKRGIPSKINTLIVPALLLISTILIVIALVLSYRMSLINSQIY